MTPEKDARRKREQRFCKAPSSKTLLKRTAREAKCYTYGKKKDFAKVCRQKQNTPRILQVKPEKK